MWVFFVCLCVYTQQKENRERERDKQTSLLANVLLIKPIMKQSAKNKNDEIKMVVNSFQ